MALEMRRDLMVSSSFSYKNSVILLCSILEKGGLKMKNTKDTTITRFSVPLRKENAPAVVEVKVIDNEFSPYMERKIQNTTDRFSVLINLKKKEERGEDISIVDDACQYFRSSERYVHMHLNILEKGIPELRTMVEKGRISVAFASRITGLSVKKQKEIVNQLKKYNRTVDANRFIAAYMKNEKGKKYVETEKEYPLLRDNQDFFPVFCSSAEALLNNVSILKEAEKAAIVNLCKNLIEKYKE